MKVVQVPAEKEEALYFSDFSGKPLDVCGPDITLTIDFGYGSENDGRHIVLHLNDEDIEDIIDLFRKKTNSISDVEFLKRFHTMGDK